ncbi:hypothetical protein [Streptomyces regalis]|uniref:Uncharacterized protein n=1 Tax=Streptomyces regalis TaxID=68262 RepID=A0A0X3VCU3_9ACTN|nr:hypothetical protein ADL12_09715 [Streptomyces regalis]
MDDPVACGGRRAQEAGDEGCGDGDAEIKRMFVEAEGWGSPAASLEHWRTARGSPDGAAW